MEEIAHLITLSRVMTLIEMILQVGSLLRTTSYRHGKIIFLTDIDPMEKSIAKIIPIMKDNMTMRKLTLADKRHLGNQLFRIITSQNELSKSNANQF